MKLLEERIRRDGIVRDGGVLKVDSFLNHQMDVTFFVEMAKEFERLYHDCGINKILTIEASGIGVACITAQVFGCPLVFAKKSKTLNIAGDVWTSRGRSDMDLLGGPIRRLGQEVRSGSRADQRF